MTRLCVASGTKWETKVGYSRAVRSGQWIAVSGTTATDEKGNISHRGDIYAQTCLCINNIERALSQADAGLHNVIRTRIYIGNMDHWEKVAKAHNEYFGDIKPATSMIQVSRFISDDILVEIEADAVLDS